MMPFEALTVDALTYQGDPKVRALLVAIAEAWTQAEATTISENEAQRWSPVCEAAAKVVA